MYFQNRYLVETKDFVDLSGLLTIDLPNKGLLSGIEVRVYGTAGVGADKPDVWLHDRLTKIELIVNGSRVVKSLTGDQLLADMLYKKTPHNDHPATNISGGQCQELFYINLGRFYHDLEYMLDLSRVNDPELRFTFNFAATSQNGWTKGVAMTDAPSIDVICHLLRDSDVIPRGYIKTSELYRFTGTSARKENMVVPRGPMYSNLYVQSWYASQGHGYILDKLELNINSDDIIPFRVGPSELVAEITRRYGILETGQWAILKGGQAYPFPMETGYVHGLIGNAELAEFAFSNIWANLGIPYFVSGAAGTPETGNHGVFMTVRGALPFSVAAIPYFDPMDERTWIDSSKLGDLWVRYEGNTNMGTNVVVKLLGDEVVTKYE